MRPYLELDFYHVALATSLVLVNGVISVLMQLKLERTLLIASVRTVVQLLLVGYLLSYIFRLQHWAPVIGVGAVMTLIAALTAAGRGPHRFAGMRAVAITAVWISAWSVTGFALLVVFRDLEKWYQPQYAIPLLGMVLGNTLNGISVGLSSFTQNLSSQRDRIESLLAMGATRWESAQSSMRDAIRTGMIPIINSMMVVGLVSLPGMMTGQLVSGMAPMQAVKYQIVIMFLIAGATTLGTVGVVCLSFLRLFDTSHRLRRERITTRKQ
ncbi:hypothetical protein Pla52n_18410 [Stieleria varia]|uniref:Iron export permease protein FetB n=2 Tax=Stieleria varia TaxID=2528005 RepID=A0A5C6B3S1_9BACT|nr:hypothetical protein Pla52n_18410 [Stieleria varia]